MRIIIYALNFKPEIVGTGKYTGDLADFLYKKGHQLKVITAPKYYPEWETTSNRYSLEDNLLYKVIRCPLYVPKFPNGIKRVIHLISFTITSLPVLINQLKWNPDCVIMISPTLFCAFNIILFEFLSSKKFLTILHIQDFELKAAFNLGILKGKLLEKLILISTVYKRS